MGSITRVQPGGYSDHGSSHTPPPSFPKASSNIWIVLEARRRSTLFHIDKVISKQGQYQGREEERPLLADSQRIHNVDAAAGTVILQPPEDPTHRQERFGRMVAHDLLTSDLVMLDVILGEIKVHKLKDFKGIHFAVFLLSTIAYELPSPLKVLKAHWLEYVLVTFWSASLGYWTYSAAGYWSLHNFRQIIQGLGDKIERGGDDVPLDEEHDRLALTGREWKFVEFFNALW
ncbi:hypothetical protein IFR05_008201 [Cadophora sp. M221]|nr:hypothetical protein IFR05_008201 [Cadophora sp. M221]